MTDKLDQAADRLAEMLTCAVSTTQAREACREILRTVVDEARRHPPVAEQWEPRVPEDGDQ